MESKEEIQAILDQAQCLYNEAEIQAALDSMALAITEELKDKNPLVLCVMTGALVFTGQLLPRLKFPLQLDYIHVTRYGGSVRGRDLHWLVEPRLSLKDRTVLILDDIMDAGLTLSAIMDFCEQEKAKDIYTAVLVSKKREREPGVHFEPDFVGVTTENKFLLGFGLDYHEYFRNVSGVYAVNLKE